MNATRPHLPDEVDTLILGAGTGGAAFAGTLAARSTEQVLLVEAGPDYGPYAGGRWPTEVLDARSIPLSHDYGLHAEAETPDKAPYGLHTRPETAGRALDLPRARVVGGCSSHNGCTASVGARFDYDEWAAWGNAGWTSQELAPLLRWVHERFRVRRYAMTELTPPQRAFVDAGLAAGLPFADDLDVLDAAVGIGPMPVNVADGGVRWNGAFAFLDPVRGRPNFRVAGDTLARRIVIENGEVRGVHLLTQQGRRFVRAGRVVVSGGAYHSPALLLRSGVGPADDLAALGVTPVVDLPGVGRHLLDHPCVQLDFAGQADLVESLAQLPWNPDEQTIGRARSSLCDQGPYDVHVFMVAGANTGHPGLPPISLYGGAMRARSEGYVTLNRDLDVTRPVIDHRYGSDPEGHDRRVLREALDLLRRMTTRPELAAVLGEFVPGRGNDPLADIVNYSHPAGSCKMGTDADAQAVVGQDGGVHGVGGLFVADASIMPAIPRGNINLPTAMIGARVAAFMLNETPERIATSSATELGERR